MNDKNIVNTQPPKYPLPEDMAQAIRITNDYVIAEALLNGDKDVNYLCHLWATELAEVFHRSGRSMMLRISAVWLARQSRLIAILLDDIHSLKASRRA